jgi:hypothetical protein
MKWFMLLLFFTTPAFADDRATAQRQTQIGMGNTIYAAMQREVDLRAQIARLEEELAAMKKTGEVNPTK